VGASHFFQISRVLVILLVIVSSQRQGASPEAGEGAHSLAKLTQATRTVNLANLPVGEDDVSG